MRRRQLAAKCRLSPFQAAVARFNERKEPVRAQARSHNAEQDLAEWLLGESVECSTKAYSRTGVLLERRLNKKDPDQGKDHAAGGQPHPSQAFDPPSRLGTHAAQAEVFEKAAGVRLGELDRRDPAPR